MSSRHLVDPSLAPLLGAFDLGELSDARLPQVRAEMRALAPPPVPAPDLTTAELHVPDKGGGSSVRVLAYAPAATGAPRPAVLHIHGGGYVLGRPESAEPANTALARALGAVVVSVDYRLAPEHPFPAALDDCFATLRWLQGGGGGLAVDPARIALFGESAGGGLAACLAQRARDAGGPPLALQALAAPMLDDRTGADGPPNAHAGEFMWTPASNRYGWGAHLRGQAGGPPPAYAVAARATDLRGLAPAFISLGALDLFLEEDLAYAARLIAAGVPTEVHVHPGAVHAFELMPGTWLGAADAATRLAALRRALGV